MAERYIPEHRRTNYKAKGAFASDVVRRRREEQQVEIRKAKREENLAKRRGITGGDGSRPGASLGAEPDSDDDTAPTESQVSWLHISSFFAQGSTSALRAGDSSMAHGTSQMARHKTQSNPWGCRSASPLPSVFTPQCGSRKILFFACVDGKGGDGPLFTEPQKDHFPALCVIFIFLVIMLTSIMI